MQNVIGIASNSEYLFHRKECALQHYPQPVTLLAELQAAGKCIFPEVKSRRIKFFAAQQVLRQICLQYWRQVQSHPCVAGNSVRS